MTYKIMMAYILVTDCLVLSVDSLPVGLSLSDPKAASDWYVKPA